MFSDRQSVGLYMSGGPLRVKRPRRLRAGCCYYTCYAFVIVYGR